MNIYLVNMHDDFGMHRIMSAHQINDDAVQYCCNEILKLCKGWDLVGNANHIKYARDINSFMIAGHFSKIIDYFNLLKSADRFFTFYEITQTILDPASTQLSQIPVANNNQNIWNSVPLYNFGVSVGGSGGISIGGTSNGIYSYTSPLPQPDPITTSAPITVPYRALYPGAKCRGPKCSYESEYAYADKPDGTFVCSQCKSFGYNG